MAQPVRRTALKGARRIPMTLMLDPECHALLRTLAGDTMSRSAFIEGLIRACASRRRVSTPAP